METIRPSKLDTDPELNGVVVYLNLLKSSELSSATEGAVNQRYARYDSEFVDFLTDFVAKGNPSEEYIDELIELTADIAEHYNQDPRQMCQVIDEILDSFDQLDVSADHNAL